MKPDLPSFGAEGEDFFPALSDGAEVMLKLLDAPEIYDSLYGEKIRIGIKVIGTNEKTPGVDLNKSYIVSSGAQCWMQLRNSWFDSSGEEYPNVRFKDFTWCLTCTVKNSKTLYNLRAMDMSD
jgi:hypothetical protein